jgi:hypothetical protein
MIYPEPYSSTSFRFAEGFAIASPKRFAIASPKRSEGEGDVLKITVSYSPVFWM